MPPSFDTFSTDNLDYIQRTGPKFGLSPLGVEQYPASLPPQLIQIRGVGRLAKSSASDMRQTAVSDWQLTQLISEDFIIGLYGLGDTLVFIITGEAGSVSLHVGLRRRNTVQDPHGDTESLAAILNGVYPGIELSERVDPKIVAKRAWSRAGLTLGIPTAKPPDLTDGAFAIDRLIRSMGESMWQALIIAEPMQESSVRTIRGQLIAEMRSSQSSAAGSGTPNPLAEHYNRLLSVALDELTNAQAVGAWSTAVYLLGTDDSYYRLAGSWRSLFSGGTSLPEPVRVWEYPDAAALAREWAVPDVAEIKGPGPYSHPYKYQTVLSSSQLAGYIHLPQLETRGFTVKLVPEFDVVPSQAQPETSICIGDVVDRTRQTDIPYLVPVNDLSGHVFVTGVTGAGKTNTVFHLLREAFARNIGCLIIEPAKKEYRALLDDPALGSKMRVFTAADENSSPIRINPFEVLQGAPLSVHLDLLRSVFASSFGMWVPLPQILEKCMLAIYEDRGWDVLTDQNRRLKGNKWDPCAFPTLTDLVLKIEEFVPTLGFDPEAQGRILASLTSRVNGLRSGGKGRMFDVQESISMEELLRWPSVLELESMGDDDDKAFMIGLLLVRLVEYRRLHGPHHMQHFLVVEEAHRLLGNVARNADQEQSDPKGKAVESFSNLLSEIRAYGQGILIADQIPTRLAPDVIKNTNLKIVHRIVSGDDREVLGRAMAMSERQVAALTSFKRGQAAVFSGATDDAPILVQIKPAKIDPAPDVLSGERVRNNFAKLRKGISPRIFRQTTACEGNCPDSNADDECKIAASLLESSPCRAAVSRLVTSISENVSAAGTLWEDIRAHIQARRRNETTDRIERCFAIRAASYVAARRGAQIGWSYQDTQEFEASLRNVFLALIGDGSESETLEHFQRCVDDLHKRTFAPFRRCDEICHQREPAVCLYRFAAADLLNSSAQGQNIASTLIAETGDVALAEVLKPGWTIAASPFEGASEEMSHIKASSVRASLCYAQQAISRQPELHARDADDLMTKIISACRTYETLAIGETSQKGVE